MVDTVVAVVENFVLVSDLLAMSVPTRLLMLRKL